MIERLAATFRGGYGDLQTLDYGFLPDNICEPLRAYVAVVIVARVWGHNSVID